MKRFLLFVVWLGAFALPALAQERRVAGKVTSAEDGNPLPGVSVVVKGTTRGTQTDSEGNYSLTVPANVGTLVFSFVGTTSQEIPVGNQSTINVRLGADTRSINEVVVVGYGSESKRNLTGNIAKVSGREIENLPVTSVEQAIQGRAAGVQITSLNGKVGQGLQIRVRGSSSVSASNQPLFVVDGIPITTGAPGDPNATAALTNPIADINFNDIESIDILKDASASAIYGSRASNGVVLITTKKGRQGKTQFELNAYGGFSNPTRRREFLNTQEYVQFFEEARANSVALGLTNITQAQLQNFFTSNAAGDRANWEQGRINTNWQDQAYQDAPIQQYDLSARGGDAKTRFYVSGSYLDQSGILISNRFRRLSGRVNLDHSATDKLTLGVNLNVARTVNNQLANDNSFTTPMQIVALPPISPVIDPTTNRLNDQTYYYNSLLDRDFASYVTTSYRVIGNVFAEYRILPGLSFRSEWGSDILTKNEEQYYGRETLLGNPNGVGINNFAQIVNYTTNNFFTFGRTFAERHDVDATVGMSYQESSTNFTQVQGRDFPSNAYKQIIAAARITAGLSTETSFSFLSYFARLNYRFNNRYLLGLVGRVDGSSRFGANNRYGIFPSASVGWILTEESFMKNIPAISNLKLRASYGLTGNAEIGNFGSRALYDGTASYGGIPGQAPSQIANPDLSWEKTLQTDIGLEFGLLDNRITGEIDYYTKNTRDLLLNVNVPGTTGFATQLRNVGQLENKGFEFVINTQNVRGAFQWSTNLNIARNTNKITNLDGQIIQGGYINQAQEGSPIGVFFGREYAGVDPQNGDALYYRNTTNADGSLDRSTTNNPNQAERVVIGNPNPSFIGGVTNTLSYKGLELSFLFQGQFGNQIYNAAGQYMSANGNFFDNQTRDQLRRWQRPGDITDVPQARLVGGNGTVESSRYLQDGDYVRLKTATLGYTLPKTLTNRAKLSRVRVYVTGQNLLTFTNYTGWDPEVNTDAAAGNIGLGNDFYSAPQPRTITAGINIGF
ncbi:TonB-dependent receptor plug [Fibrisoma limi BUZ 3]|uniref:TonB-dependent receptor plug n=1 Tax=Fibrisoma limi BUZ 3 TaxID=1185876 RepID=I2GCN4_9BACT|nr:TonB-dependent receptor [Fibrisoma limi]CCH51658.1 TonB-dependent receptor plug [Fibrisoma limi BUZ 3]